MGINLKRAINERSPTSDHPRAITHERSPTSDQYSAINSERSVTLDQRDFVEAVAAQTELVDVVWIGLSLHHLRAPEKMTFMRGLRGILQNGGLFLIYENTSPDGEDRDTWLRRWDLQKASWTAYTEEEWNAMAAHVHAADFPETDANWHKLGGEAGFASVRQLFVAPTDLFRMYCFAA